MNEVSISVRGVQVRVPSLSVGNRQLVVSRGWLRTVTIQDEQYMEGDPVGDPELIIQTLAERRVQADIFSFSQRLPDTTPRHAYPYVWDNVAVVPTQSYEDWWARLSQETRRNVRLAGKRGLRVEAVPFDDRLVAGIAGIYNETSVRQGRRFWHYGKDLATVKRDNGTYRERSEFIAAYAGDELAGFIKMVYVDKLASIMQILCKNSHQDKKVMNALVAKAVELCAKKGMGHLVYCKYVYHKNIQDPLTEFKRRNGFQKVLVPCYHVPLSWRGRLAISLRLQLPLSELLPEPMVVALLKLRAWYYARKAAAISNPSSTTKTAEVGPAG